MQLKHGVDGDIVVSYIHYLFIGARSPSSTPSFSLVRSLSRRDSDEKGADSMHRIKSEQITAFMTCKLHCHTHAAAA